MSGRRLGEVLCERGLLTPEQLQSALEEQSREPNKLIGAILIDRGYVSEEDALRALAESLDMPFVRITRDMVSPGALKALPEQFLEENNLLPLSNESDCLAIAVERFTDVFLLDEISCRTGCSVAVFAATGANIREVRHALLPPSTTRQLMSDAAEDESLGSILNEIGVDDVRIVESVVEDDTELGLHAAESPIVKLVNFIIQTAAQISASDIHIEPAEGVFRVRYRVDGDLVQSITPPARLLPAVVSRIKILAAMDISERRLPQDGSVTVTLLDRPIDLRISTMAAKFGEKVVIRLVDRDTGVRPLDSIGMSPTTLEHFRATLRQPNGMILVTGPTGSGKSTTLYGALLELISGKRNISTIEDPVERILAGANQFQVHPKLGYTFATALRSMLRQDPDIIMVGEIRDPETAKLATEAALTGHLVLSTLHTNDAPTTIPRLINMGVEPYLVAASLRGVLAQRLVRRNCPNCTVMSPLEQPQRDVIAAMCDGECPIDTIPVSAGCEQCDGAGMRGRIGVFDFMPLNEAMLSTWIARDGGDNPTITTAPSTGLLHDGLDKVAQGLISLDALFAVVSHVHQPLNTTSRSKAA